VNRRTKDQILVYGTLTVAGLFVLAVALGVLAFGGLGSFLGLAAIGGAYFIARAAF